MRRQVIDWPITLRLVEQDGGTEAQITLDTILTVMTSSGRAHRNPADPEAPVIGDELAAGRALIDLGNRLVRMADAGLDELDERSRDPHRCSPPVGGWFRD